MRGRWLASVETLPPASKRSPRLKVALFHTTLPRPGEKHGGVELTVHRLANALIEHERLDVTVFSCDAKPPHALYAHTQLFRGGLRSRVARLSILSLALNIVDFNGFDILHLHGDDWFFFRRRVPTIRTLHGSALHEARSAARLRRRLAQYAVYPLERLSARLATRTLAVGPEAGRLYRADGLADNGVDTDLFMPRPKAEFPLLAYVGAWRGRKRGAFAYETFVTQILPAFPEARLYMACDHVPVHDSVIDGGAPDDRTLAEWISKAWLFIYPSAYEGFGIPYIEALASETPVVTTANSGADYVLEGGRYGTICTDAQFGAAIIALLRNPERRTKSAILGRAHAMRFSWPEVARAHAEIYQAVIARYHNRRCL